jgi:hypothetical protein
MLNLDTPQRREVFLTVVVLFLAASWFMTRALQRPDTAVHVPPPSPTFAPPQYDPEVHRLRNLAMCVDTRDELRAQCEREGTLSACDRWVEATFICARYDLPTTSQEDNQ